MFIRFILIYQLEQLLAFVRTASKGKYQFWEESRLILLSAFYLEIPKAYSKPYQTSKMVHFMKLLTIFAKSSIWDIWQGSVEYIYEYIYCEMNKSICEEINRWKNW